MGAFSNVRAAKVFKTGQYYLQGSYRVRVDTVKTIVSAEKTGKPFFIVETTCLESDNPDIEVGKEYSQVVDMQNIMAGANIKVFLAAATGLDAYMDNDALNDSIEQRWSEMLGRKVGMEEICEIATGSSNPLNGIELGLNCVNVRTRPTPLKPDGGTFTRYQWFALEEDDQLQAS